MPLDRAWIVAHIPHQGSMCLLEEVIHWDAQAIRCRTGTQRMADHPLRAHGRLGIGCGIEYAAQAMAIHAVLAAAQPDPGAPSAGFLAGVRAARLYVSRLDDVAGDLICDATRVAGDRETALYEFSLSSAEKLLMSGRLSALLAPALGIAR